MPTARLGAPPVRESSVCSPTCARQRLERRRDRSAKPQPAIAAAALSTVVPITAGGELIAK